MRASTKSYSYVNNLLTFLWDFVVSSKVVIFVLKSGKVNIPLIKIEKKTNGKIEQAKVLISIFCQLSNIKLSDTEKTILAYFIVYKMVTPTEELILKAQLATVDSLRNVMTKLRKVGLIKKMNKKDVIIDGLNVELEPVMGIIIKIDNK